MNADTCVSYCDMTSMDSYYNSPSPHGRDQPSDPFRIFQPSETKYNPTFLLKGQQGYEEKSRSPFQQECQSLDDGTEEGNNNFNKYHLFMQRPTCKTPPEGEKLHQESGGHNDALIPCYGEFQTVPFAWGIINSQRFLKTNALRTDALTKIKTFYSYLYRFKTSYSYLYRFHSNKKFTSYFLSHFRGK